MPFIDDRKITAEAPTATGTTTILSSAYDMTGFDGICFIVRLGTPAANNNIRATQATTSGGSYNDLQGTLVNSATANCHIIDVYRPQKQFVKCSVARGTSTTIDSLVAIQYHAKGMRPVSQPSSTIAEGWSAPPEGTA